MHATEPAAKFVFCWDGKGATWRHLAKLGYKEHRILDKRQQEASKQVSEAEDILRPLMKELGFWTPRIPAVEADDLIGILARALSHSHKVLIYSSDKDMLQLASDRVRIWRKWSEEPLGPVEVEKEMGVPPKHVTEVRALAGDVSDNLKGLPGIGPKKAVLLWAAGIRASRANVDLRGTPHAPHWPRILKEFELAKIITDVDSTHWTEEQRGKLGRLVSMVTANPGRRPRDKHRVQKAWYTFLAEYELTELFQERHLLQRIT
jgi:hypothetical protein